ncbi:sugar phosphate isomerase/epimerase family protein [Paenibacillus sp. LHD-117]|uniref:sugar phosphate isomerase/epimerase family protein n=1 Tax=Paenibacillus sp. LHD-117 TaxID=3071412 RepID=UPI0027E1147D|nr:sugar phosphate isomerase/epimerase family protein [Paenibacillus sp. LHD-117]MDQ6421244.1 sugar phosphate isomerase/epimerase family protein [Paenibacillus sp. LHD-117]
MKLGVSTYSLHQAFASGELTVEGVIDYIGSIGAEHVEIVPLGFSLIEDPSLIETIRGAAASNGLELSNYAIGANFADKEGQALREEIERVKREVDVCAALGMNRMRHDVASSQDLSIGHFLAQLPKLVEACREIADYAASFGITTSVENHGYFVQQSDRVQALVQAVGRDNFRTTLDVGNFLCADENPSRAVANNIALASMVHVKDFYVRPSYRYPGEGWFKSSGGNYLRGAIAGQGDIDMPNVLRIVKESGYDGYVSIEFEGMEECRKGTKLAFDYVKQTWEQL